MSPRRAAPTDVSGEVVLYDTTLRDGAAREGMTLSMLDKVKIAQRLAKFGIAYIEAGYPGSNPKDGELFRVLRDDPDVAPALVAFGATRRKKTDAARDEGLRALLASGANKICIFGKTWDFHVRVALETTEEENLAMIGDSVAYLKSKGREVIYDAEHFFDGFEANPAYAKATLRAAAQAGADYVVLCDTNGGTLPGRVAEIVDELRREGFARLGIHTHNDSGCAVANSLAAVERGCVMVQGTINGYGERTGNANLCTIAPALELKMNRRCLPPGHLKDLTDVSHFVSEVANLHHDPYQPFVGKSAFAHKGGAHGSAVSRDARTYEHVDPRLVGNVNKLVVSEIAGRSMILHRASELGLKLGKEQIEHLLGRVKHLEYQGYTYEAADASLGLLLLREAKLLRPFFTVDAYDIHLHRRTERDMLVDATVKVRVRGTRYVTAAEGNGPVNALDNALRKCLEPVFEELRLISLLDYKVRVLEGADGTKAITRVLIETGDGHVTWGTIGVSENVIKASWDALYDAIVWGLYLHRRNGKRP